MAARSVVGIRSVCTLLITVPMLSFASDEQSAIEAAGDATNELIAYTRVLFDCEMLIESIEPWPTQSPQEGIFFVTLETEGKECEQAFDVLNHRGRNRGLFFGLPKYGDTEDERPAGTNLGRILETDPEVNE